MCRRLYPICSFQIIQRVSLFAAIGFGPEFETGKQTEQKRGAENERERDYEIEKEGGVIEGHENVTQKY